MAIELTEERIGMAIEERKEEAMQLLKEKDKLEVYLLKAEEKLKNMESVDVGFENVPILLSMIRAYVKKEYTDVPLMTIVGILAAIIYYVAPHDLIPDYIPYVGKVDDVLVMAFIMNLVAADVQIYRDWREEQFNKSENRE